MCLKELKNKKLKRKHETVQRQVGEQNMLSANKDIHILIGSMPFEWRQNEYNGLKLK